LKDFFQTSSSNKIFLSLLCESYSLNYKLKEQIEHWFDNMPITKKEEREIITVSHHEAMLMEASIFAREQIKSDLRRHFHISNHYN
jgi:DNA-binding transcriptional regulator/RsmH inhibitor MraZ